MMRERTYQKYGTVVNVVGKTNSMAGQDTPEPNAYGDHVRAAMQAAIREARIPRHSPRGVSTKESVHLLGDLSPQCH